MGTRRKKPQSRKAGTGTILVREWQGNAGRLPCSMTELSFNGKRYRSLSEVAREITGSRWSGPRSLDCDCLRWRTTMQRPKAPIRRCAIYTRKSSRRVWSRTSIRCTRSARPAKRSSRVRPVRAGAWSRPPTTTAVSRAGRWSGRRCSVCCPISARAGRCGGGVQGRPTDSLAGGLRQDGRSVRRRGVSFVAVTQQFNTTTSMGRLTLNVLLSFAQFEREVTGERIRDKIAASKQKGMWMGGLVPLGYDVHERRLVANQSEAETVREIFRRYRRARSARLLMEDLNRRGIRSKVRVAKNGRKSGGNSFFRGALYQLLSIPFTSVRFVTRAFAIWVAWADRRPRVVGKDAAAAAEPRGSTRCGQRNQSQVR